MFYWSNWSWSIFKIISCLPILYFCVSLNFQYIFFCILVLYLLFWCMNVVLDVNWCDETRWYLRLFILKKHQSNFVTLRLNKIKSKIILIAYFLVTLSVFNSFTKRTHTYTNTMPYLYIQIQTGWLMWAARDPREENGFIASRTWRRSFSWSRCPSTTKFCLSPRMR